MGLPTTYGLVPAVYDGPPRAKAGCYERSDKKLRARPALAAPEFTSRSLTAVRPLRAVLTRGRAARPREQSGSLASTTLV